MVMFRVIPSINHAKLDLNLQGTYTPFNFFSFCVVAGIDEMRRSWKFQLLFVCLFFLYCFVQRSQFYVFQHQKCAVICRDMEDNFERGKMLW